MGILKKRKIKRWLISPIIALLVFILTQVFAFTPYFIEKIYAQNIYPVFATIISFFSQAFPFSIDDLFYLMLILGVISIMVLLLTKKITIIKTGKLLLNVLAVVYILFYFLWGFNYFRNDLNSRLSILEQKPNTDEFIFILKNTIENTNKSFTSFQNFNRVEIDSLVEDSYKTLAPALKLKYPAGKRKPKYITLSNFFAKAGISGYFGPFFNEVHINKNNLPVEYPFVLAHEKAHQFGITSEAEANFYAWLVCTQSSSKELQYSANLNILRFFMIQGYELEEYQEIITCLDENVKNDFRKIQEHWMNLRNEKIDKVATKVNDTYLKTNKVEKGVEDYRGVVKIVMDFSFDTVYQKKYNLSPN